MNHLGVNIAESVQFEPLSRVGTAFDAGLDSDHSRHWQLMRSRLVSQALVVDSS
ncbi:hypothetical protein B0H12DRAFT_1119404 [Mycena haematopus]|nr:hypothetical protein B0H12DRAFT_1119404 [Mycena haematopus]